LSRFGYTVLLIIHSLPATLFVDTASHATDATTAAVYKATDSVNPATDSVNTATDATSTSSAMARTWRDLKVFQEEEDDIIRHLYNSGRSADPPMKPTKVVLYSLQQKYLLMSGRINIKRMEDGEPVYEPGVAEEVEASGSQPPSQSSQSLQAALANLTSSQLNSAQLKALRKEQEQAQAEAQEKKTRDDEEKEQKHQADRQVRHEAYIARNDELPPCPLRCRGKECTMECANNVMYRLTQTRAHPQLGTATCGTSRQRGRQKTLEGGPQARGTAPCETATRRPTTLANAKAISSPTRRTRCLPSSSRPRRQKLQRHCMQTWSRENLRRSSSSSDS
jgi:hypothetical protein